MRSDNDYEEEIRQHIAMETQANIDRGMSAEEASRAARISFGSVEGTRQQLREGRRTYGLSTLSQDFRYAIRSLTRQPAFALVAVVTLALGIGANTAIFSVLNGVLLQDLPYKNPDRLYTLHTQKTQAIPTGLVAPRFIEPLNEGHPAVEAAAVGFLNQSPVIGSDGTPALLVRYAVTRRFFDVFTDPMTLGRGFNKDDRGNAIIISEATWRRLFNANPGILGTTITVDNAQRTVVGVAAKGFEFPRDADAWSPLIPSGPLLDLVNYEGYLRLKPGVSREKLESHLPILSQQVGPFGATRQAVGFVVSPLLDDIVGNVRPTIWILSGATAVLLLVACLNVSSLLLSRTTARTREVAIRGALGARPVRILRQLLVEGVVLTSVGGLAGLALSYAGLGLLGSIAPSNLPRMDSISVNQSVLLYSAFITIVVGLLVGLAPAFRLLRTDLRSLLNEGRSGGGPGHSRMLGTLVVAEIGLAVLLVIGAGLLVRSYQAIIAVDTGIRPERIVTFVLNVPTSYIDPKTQIDAQGRQQYIGTGHVPIVNFYNALLEKIRGLAGVESVAATSTLPLSGDSQFNWDPPEIVTIGGGPHDGTKTSRVYGRRVSPSFFETLGVRLISGRTLLPSDSREAPGATVVNETFVRDYFAGDNPIGRRLKVSNDSWRYGGLGFGFGERVVEDLEIVGVVADVHYAAMTEPAEPSFYLTQSQAPFRRMTVMVRTALPDPASLAPAIRQEIAALDPKLPTEFAVYARTVASSIGRQRLGMVLLAVFGGVALTLAAIGIYGLMSYTVTLRAGEIAVRAALGATSDQVRQLLMRRGLFLGLAGVVLGVVSAMALRRVIASEIYEISSIDPIVFIAVPLALFGVSYLASWLPARRAARILPSTLLRRN